MTNERILFSSEINEIIGHPPHWVTRVGSAVLLLMIAGFLIISATVSIPKQRVFPVMLYGDQSDGGHTAGKNTPGYLIKGTLDAGQLESLKKSGELRVEVPLEGDAREKISLKGNLLRVIPPVRNGKIAYTLRLEPNSAKLLAAELPAIESIAGTLTIESEKKTIMKSMLE
ncbi:MAG TPA: hypothetical protein VGC08_06845 [Pedobacter sp.]